MRASVEILWLALGSLPLVFAMNAGREAGAGAPQTQPAREHEHHHGDDDATVRHPFDDVEKWVGIFDDPSRDEWQKPEMVVEALAIQPGMAVADIGAGTGYFNRRLAAAVGPSGKVYAVDVEPKLVDHMKARAEKEKTANVVPVLAEPADPKLPEKGVDRILICDTYHHIDDRRTYFDRIKKSLRPGATITVVDFQKRELPVGPPPEHKLEPEQVIEEMQAAGWRLSARKDFLPYQYFLTFEVK
jgi:ubiquinone/menaquinone biosynthesis C-methylase UbiE